MVGLALGLVKSWKLWAIIALVTVSFFVVNAYNGAIETAVREKERSDEWHNAAMQWKAAYTRSEDFREQEQRSAVSSASRERQQCNQRVADSLKSSKAIREVVRVPVQTTPNTCPVVSVITSDELRDALGAN